MTDLAQQDLIVFIVKFYIVNKLWRNLNIYKACVLGLLLVCVIVQGIMVKKKEAKRENMMKTKKKPLKNNQLK